MRKRIGGAYSYSLLTPCLNEPSQHEPNQGYHLQEPIEMFEHWIGCGCQFWDAGKDIFWHVAIDEHLASSSSGAPTLAE